MWRRRLPDPPAWLEYSRAGRRLSIRPTPHRHSPRGARMLAKGLNPILNVSDMQASLGWVEKLGWSKVWDWGDPPTFAAVGSGECEIFLCQGGQGGRGRGPARMTFGPTGDQGGGKGVGMALGVEAVDEVHRECLARGFEITFPPTNMSWNVREMHLRHPDGHVFRIGHRLEEEEE